MLVAGVDSSTQSCKIVIRDLETGEVKRKGSAKHPEGTEVNPQAWWLALQEAISEAGGIDDVAAISIAAQQHGMVVLDSEGRVIRDALLWNDTRSAQAADDLIAEIGSDEFAARTGSVPVASFTITKLRWLRDAEPQNAAKVAAVALPHDWLTWRLLGYGPAGESELGPDLNALTTDASDASGTGYFDSIKNEYVEEFIVKALGHLPILPRVVSSAEAAGKTTNGIIVGAGAGDNAGAALGLGAHPGDIVISIGTSGTVFSVSSTPTQDASGRVAGFADGSGEYLPLVATLNAARILKWSADLLGADFDEYSKAALSAEPGSGGIVLLPYFEGERTPNLPTAKASIHSLTLSNYKRENIARASIEGMLCGLADGLDALLKLGVAAKRILLIGGGAQNEAVQEVARTIFTEPIEIPSVSEYVAEGASVQAAWALTGNRPAWSATATKLAPSQPVASIRANYQAQRQATWSV